MLCDKCGQREALPESHIGAGNLRGNLCRECAGAAAEEFFADLIARRPDSGPAKSGMRPQDFAAQFLRFRGVAQRVLDETPGIDLTSEAFRQRVSELLARPDGTGPDDPRAPG